MYTIVIPLTCRYQSRRLLRVDSLDRSNVKSIATASLHTSGSILANCFWPFFFIGILSTNHIHLPPRSHILNVISVCRMDIVFSIKLTPFLLLFISISWSLSYYVYMCWCIPNVCIYSGSYAPSAYLIIKLVLPICVSPTIPIFSTTLYKM